MPGPSVPQGSPGQRTCRTTLLTFDLGVLHRKDHAI